MISIAVAAAIGVLSGQTAPTGQTPAATPLPPVDVAQAGTAQAQDEGDRQVCRREVVLGSNRRERVCMTVRQRDALRADSRSAVEAQGRFDINHPSPTVDGGGPPMRGF